MTPKRIQRKRERGWRMPPNTVYVGRPSRWGNWFKPGETYMWLRPGIGEPDWPIPTWRDPGDYDYGIRVVRCESVEQSIEWYRAWVESFEPHHFRDLRGKDLACWCPTCEAHADGLPLGVACPDCAPCHTTVLLELANVEVTV